MHYSTIHYFGAQVPQVTALAAFGPGAVTLNTHNWVTQLHRDGTIPLGEKSLRLTPRCISKSATIVAAMDNKAIAGILYETADLLEIDGAGFLPHSFLPQCRAGDRGAATANVRPHRRTQETAGGAWYRQRHARQSAASLSEKDTVEIHVELLKNIAPPCLELLKIQGLGPKTIALIWSAYQVSDLNGVEKLAREGKIRTLPRMGEKHEQKLLKAIEDSRRIGGRFLINTAESWLKS